jgi:5-methylcytosine-specific restriction endonuclease McrA
MTTTEAILSAVLGRDLPECQSPNRTWCPPERDKRDDYERWKFRFKVDLWEAQLMRCYYCGSSIEEVSPANLEHKNPLVYGGDDSEGNLVLSCYRCNLIKGTMTELEFISWLVLEQEDGKRHLERPEGFDENLPLDPKALISNLR